MEIAAAINNFKETRFIRSLIAIADRAIPSIQIKAYVKHCFLRRRTSAGNSAQLALCNRPYSLLDAPQT